jgi:hypothetical protein
VSPSQARGALLLLFDVAAAAIDEHDDWHTHEHMPERLAIPGFLRGTRWTRTTPGARYCVLYEVAEPAVLDSPAYRERLDHPTQWTVRMMPHYLGMRRSLCEVVAGDGSGVGGACLVVSFAPAPGYETTLRERLVADVLPGLAERRGLASCRLLESALPAGMTREQSLRGRDAAVHSALWATGYDGRALAALAANELHPERLAGYGAAGTEHAVFQLAHVLGASGA